MGALKIGRVGLDVASTDNVNHVQWSSTDGKRTLRLTGRFRASSVANSKALRNEMSAQTGKLVAVTWDQDSDVDGFYILRSAELTATLRSNAYGGQGLFPFTVSLDRVGGESETEIQSLITGTVLSNVHGLIAAETKPFHSAPIGHLAYNAGTGSPTERTRAGEDGAVTWYDGIDNTVDPTWSVAPSAFYSGTVSLKVASLLRSGTDVPNDVTDFTLSNTLVRVTPDLTTGSSNGRINLEWYDGSQWDTAVTFKIVFNAGVSNDVIPQWHYMSVLRNDPETATIRLTRDALTGASPHRHILDISLRRGSRFVSFYFTFTGTAVPWDVIRDTNDTAAAFTPAGATGAVGVLDSTATDGNKWLIATSVAHTARTTEGGIRTGSVQSFDFMIGAEVGAPGTGDAAADLALQYFGWVSERDRAVRR